MKPLDPSWWRRAGSGYEQQGCARLSGLKTRTKITGWSLYIHDEYRGNWPTLRQAKQRAFEITSEASK